MLTECSPKSMSFARVDGRAVVADFGGGAITSDAGALLLGATDRAIRLVDRFAACFSDGRMPGRVCHDVATLVGQRVFGIALGYEDLIDHDDLRRDPALGAALGRIEARRPGLAPLAGKSTLNRLEHAPQERSGGRTATTASATTPPPSRRCSSNCSLTRTRSHPRVSRSTSTPPTTRSTGIRRDGSSTATTTPTATCRSTSSAAITCWRRSSGAPTSTPAPAPPRRSPASPRRSVRAGPA